MITLKDVSRFSYKTWVCLRNLQPQNNSKMFFPMGHSIIDIQNNVYYTVFLM